jgi:ubiquitin C-terminal hydrolase
MSLIPHQSDFSIGIFGLNNTGTLCYLNSLVQALAACPSFVKTIFDNEDEFKAKPEKLGWELLQLFSRFKQKVQVSATRHIKVDTTTRILSEIQRSRAGHTSTLGTGTQEDVFEGLKFIIESLDPTFQDLFNVRYRQTIRCCECNKTRQVDNKACPSEIMLNMSENDPMLQESLDTQEDVEKYINLHMHYPDDYKCDDCKIQNTKDVKKVQQFYSLARVSSILVMSFHDNQQRLYDRSGPKVARYFPDMLQIKGVNQNLIYRPVAQIEQLGTLGGGHYTAKCLRPRPEGLSEMRLSAARAALKDAKDRLPSSFNEERRLQYENKIKMAQMTIDEEEAIAALPVGSFNKQYATFKFNDNRVNYDPRGFQPSPNTYLVFYHLFSN